MLTACLPGGPRKTGLGVAGAGPRPIHQSAGGSFDKRSRTG